MRVVYLPDISAMKNEHEIPMTILRRVRCESGAIITIVSRRADLMVGLVAEWQKAVLDS